MVTWHRPPLHIGITSIGCDSKEGFLFVPSTDITHTNVNVTSPLGLRSGRRESGNTLLRNGHTEQMRTDGGNVT